MRKQIKNIVEEYLSKNKHLQPVYPSRYVYHTSNPIFRDKIAIEGLIPQGKDSSWLSDTKIDGKVIFAVDDTEYWDTTYDDDIYKIDTSKLKNKWYNDPNFGYDKKHIITFERIPQEAIELVYLGTPYKNKF